MKTTPRTRLRSVITLTAAMTRRMPHPYHLVAAGKPLEGVQDIPGESMVVDTCLELRPKLIDYARTSRSAPPACSTFHEGSQLREAKRRDAAAGQPEWRNTNIYKVVDAGFRRRDDEHAQLVQSYRERHGRGRGRVGEADARGQTQPHLWLGKALPCCSLRLG